MCVATVLLGRKSRRKLRNRFDYRRRIILSKEMEIIEYIKKIESEYDTKIDYTKAEKREKLINVPEKLKELYKETDGIVFPFGRVYSIEEALEQSENEDKRYFCFGIDYLNEHKWLCLFTPNEMGKSFNLCAICKPDEVDGLYEDVIEFFEDMRGYYDEDPWNVIEIKRAKNINV